MFRLEMTSQGINKIETHGFPPAKDPRDGPRALNCGCGSYPTGKGARGCGYPGIPGGIPPAIPPGPYAAANSGGGAPFRGPK